MAELDELAASLRQLSDDYYGDKRKARETDFFDKYGDRFSNDRSIGLAILNELDDRGVDVSAADEAVQEIIDTLLGECDALRGKLKSVQRAQDKLEDKLDKVQDAIDTAVAGDSEATKDIDVGGDEMPDAGAGAEAPIDDGGMPPDAGAMPPDMPPDAGAGAPPDAGAGTPPPPDAGAMPPDMPPEGQAPTVPSDYRIKNVRTCLSDVRMKRIKRRENSFVPSAGMIAAAQRGY